MKIIQIIKDTDSYILGLADNGKVYYFSESKKAWVLHYDNIFEEVIHIIPIAL